MRNLVKEWRKEEIDDLYFVENWENGAITNLHVIGGFWNLNQINNVLNKLYEKYNYSPKGNWIGDFASVIRTKNREDTLKLLKRNE